MQDQVIISIVSGLVVALLIWIVKAIKDSKDTLKIINFLEESARTTAHTFRSNHAISSNINLSEDRVRKLCSKSKKIKRNTNPKESWKLTT